MRNCKKCQNEILDGNLMECPNCNALICSSCGQKSFGICPYCYHNLDFMG